MSKAEQPLLLTGDIWMIRGDAARSAERAMNERAARGEPFTVEASSAARLFGTELSTEEDGYGTPCGYEVAGGVAVICIVGTITKYWSWLGCSITDAMRAVDHASRNPEVSSIMLMVDSAGGMISGVGELSDLIGRVNKEKPVWCYASGALGSAAYWAVCQAERIITSEGTLVGSIGIVNGLMDTSAAYKDSGVKAYKFVTGPYKAPGMFGSAVTKEQRDHIQSLVDGAGEMFAADIRAGRGIDCVMGEGIADGREWWAPEAMSMGLIDGIAPPSAVIARMQTGQGMRRADAFLLPSATGEIMKNTIEADGSPSAIQAAVANALAAFGIKPKQNEPKQDAPSADAASTGDTTNPLSAVATAIGLPETATAAEISASFAEMKEQAGKSESLAASLKAEVDSLRALAADGSLARSKAIETLASETNRIMGAGSVTVEALTAGSSGKSLADIYAAIEPLAKAAEAKFAASPSTPAASGRQTVDTTPEVTAKAAADAAKLQEDSRIEHDLRQLYGNF